MLQQLGKTDAALQALDAAVSLSPNEVTRIRARAYARLELDLLNETLADLNPAVRIALDFAYTRNERDALVKRLSENDGGGDG